MKKQLFLIILAWYCIATRAFAVNEISYQPEFSTAGFFAVEGTGREVFSMNPAWRFAKGEMPQAEKADYDDSKWDVVSLPHGIEYLPTEASGCLNYQGVVWYRKHFTPEDSWKGKRCLLHFEAIMGKSRVYVNGQLAKEHFGGYLPVVMDVSDLLLEGKDNVIAVWADNSNDPAYPPGKPQEHLDFTYCGGIYRDCWMITYNPLHITDPNLEQETAGGGLFVANTFISEQQADLALKLHLRNEGEKDFHGTVTYTLTQKDGTEVASVTKKVNVKKGQASNTSCTMRVKDPSLWTPSTPTLYNLNVKIHDTKGMVVDGYRRRIGLRSIEFRGAEGFFLNGKHYERPLIGANRHQDFAIVGNAVANSLHWRDAKKLKDAGLEVIRNAHCPQDPAFMDACDELGLFILDNTPGWQFWNEDPIFAERVYDDIRNLVRRDRNHACLWLWEPILNETSYPEDFAQNALNIVHEEFPYPYCYCGCDESAMGSSIFPVLFAHPLKTLDGGEKTDSTKTYFTREWGDNVDDWGSHNSNSRVARSWGERPMLVQSEHYAYLDATTNFQSLFSQKPQHIGGCLWHSFDHQRGYHPDPFYGGIMDNFRQPKYSYYMFQSQRPAEKTDVPFETGPMVYIAHEMTPFSDNDVTVYSNCDEVHLTYCTDGKTQIYKRDKKQPGMPSPIIKFENAYNFMTDKYKSRDGKGNDVFLRAEGYIDGKLVATHEVRPSRRPEKLLLWIDDEGTGLKADGSDCVVVVAAISDGAGHIKRLNKEYIQLEVEGEGRILGSASIHANPALVQWGTAPFILQSTTKPGKITLRASLLYQGSEKAPTATLEIESKKADNTLIFSPSEERLIPLTNKSEKIGKTATALSEEEEKARKEVEQQQTDFGE